jgi:hypothetical protein
MGYFILSFIMVNVDKLKKFRGYFALSLVMYRWV